MIIYRKNTFVITKPKSPNLIWAYQLPFCEKQKEFKTLKEAKDYIDKCLNEMDI